MKSRLFHNKSWRQSGLILLVSALISSYASLACSIQYVSADTNTSYVRVIHASPFVGTADVFVDGKPFLSSFQFAAITDYAALPAGQHKVQISLVGKGIGAAALAKTLQISPGKAYTVAAVGDTPQSLNLQVFVDNNNLVANLAKVRVYHLIPNAKKVDISIGEDVSIKDMNYENESNYVNVDSGPCTFELTIPLLNIKLSLPKELEANTVTSIFAIGMLNGNPKAQLVAATTAGIPGLPQTGAIPILADFATPTPAIWLFIGALLVMVGLGATRHFRPRS